MPGGPGDFAKYTRLKKAHFSTPDFFCNRLCLLGVAKAIFFFPICNRLWGGLFSPEFGRFYCHCIGCDLFQNSEK